MAIRILPMDDSMIDYFVSLAAIAWRKNAQDVAHVKHNTPHPAAIQVQIIIKHWPAKPHEEFWNVKLWPCYLTPLPWSFILVNFNTQANFWWGVALVWTFYLLWMFGYVISFPLDVHHCASLCGQFNSCIHSNGQCKQTYVWIGKQDSAAA